MPATSSSGFSMAASFKTGNLVGPVIQGDTIPLICAAIPQNVSEIAMLAYRPDWPGAGASILNFKARFRDGGLAEFSGECKEGRGDVLACGMECDGGPFALRKAGGGAIMVDMPAAPSLCSDGEGADFAADDKLFRLDRTDLADCRDLIWDDEIRPRLLRAAGQ